MALLDDLSRSLAVHLYKSQYFITWWLMYGYYSCFMHKQRLVMNALQCLDAISRLADQGDHDKNGFKSFESQHTLSYFTRLSSVDYPRDSEGNISAIIHPSLQVCPRHCICGVSFFLHWFYVSSMALSLSFCSNLLCSFLLLTVQGKDFQPLQSGAAVFWNLDDDAPQPLQQQYSHDVYPFFINEVRSSIFRLSVWKRAVRWCCLNLLHS